MTTRGQRIKNRRIEIGLTQKELGTRIGVRAPTVSDWESDTIKEIDGSNLIKLSKALERSPDWILTGSTKKEDLIEGSNDPYKTILPSGVKLDPLDELLIEVALGLPDAKKRHLIQTARLLDQEKSPPK